MTAYFVGDVPAEDLVIEPARAGMAIDLAPFNAVTLVLRDPAGEIVDPSGLTAALDAGEGTVTVTWPTTTILGSAGIYELTVKLTGTGSKKETLSPERIIVEAEGTGWYTLEQARLDWPDAPDADYLLYDYLTVARGQVLAYAPDLDEGELPPPNYKKAQLMQARNMWNADKGEPNTGEFGTGAFIVTPKPLDWAVKQMLRPRTGRPVMG